MTNMSVKPGIHLVKVKIPHFKNTVKIHSATADFLVMSPGSQTR